MYIPVLNPFSGELQYVLDQTIFPLRGSVATTADLPLTGNQQNDCYVVQDDDSIYTWNSSESSGTIDKWINVAHAGSVEWDAILSKPSSSTTDIDDAVAKKHSHTNKTTLDNTEESFTTALKNKLDGIEASADVTDATNVASSIHGVTGKATPVDADEIGLIDSQASNALKVLTWANLKATLKSYIDSMTSIFTNKELSDHIETLELTAGESLSAGDLCYFKSDGKMWKVDADASATSKGVLGICLETTLAGDATGTFLIKGKYTTTGLTAGDELYISTTTGEWTNTMPSSTGDIIRIIGYSLSTTVLYFDPDKSYVEVG